MNPTALSRFRVCDVTTGMVGPLATRWLGAFGASVIKVEDLSNPDGTRQQGPYRDQRHGPELSARFNNVNAEKWGVAIDLGATQGRRLLGQLMASCQLVCLDGRLSDFDLTLDQLNQSSADATTATTLVVEGMGELAVTGNGEQTMMANQVTIDILLALWSEENGPEQTDRIKLIDVSRTTITDAIAPPPTQANDQPSGLFACRAEGQVDDEADWVAIDCRDEGDWAALQVAIDGDDAGRGKQPDGDRVAVVQRWAADRNKWQVEAELQAVGVPVAALRSPDERIDADIASGARHLWPMVDHPEIGGVRIEGLPVELSKTPWRFDEAAPLVGQDTEWVLRQLLDHDEHQIERLRSLGVIGLA